MSFHDRIVELHSSLPDKAEVTVTVNQVYARYIHEHLEFRHPRGGQAKYLEQPWMGGATDFARRLAKWDNDPSLLRDQLDGIAEDGVRMVFDHAPVEFDDLRRSGHGTVAEDGHVTFSVGPEVHRLTEEELREKSRLRDAGDADLYRHVLNTPLENL